MLILFSTAIYPTKSSGYIPSTASINGNQYVFLKKENVNKRDFTIWHIHISNVTSVKSKSKQPKKTI